MDTKYNIKVKLTGTDSNAFALMGRVKQALRKAGAPQEDIEAFFEEAMSGDYNHLLKVCMDWVDVT